MAPMAKRSRKKDAKPADEPAPEAPGLWPGPLAILLIVLATLAATGPLLLHEGLPHASDSSYAVQFVRGFTRALAEGELYPRWIADGNRGLGAPVFVVYPPLVYYLAAFVQSFTGDPLEAVRWTVVLLTFLGGLFAWRAARDVAGVVPASLAATLYVLLPYHLVDIYERLAFAELAGLTLLPLFLATLRRFALDPGRVTFLTASATAALLLLAHPMTALLGTVVLTPVVASLPSPGSGRSGRWIRPLLPIGAGALLAAVYLLPLVVERGTLDPTHLEQLRYQPIANLLWRADPAIQDPTRPRLEAGAITTGGLALLTFILHLVIFRRTRPQNGDDGGAGCEVGLLLAASLVSLALQTGISEPFWSWVPGMRLVQFPWRFGSIQVLTVSVGLAGFLQILSTRQGLPQGARRDAWLLMSAACLPALVLAGRTTAARPYSLGQALAHYPNYHDRILQEFLPRGAPTPGDIAAHPQAIQQSYATGDPAAVDILAWKAQDRVIDVNTNGTTTVWVRCLSYPGWSVTLDGQDVPSLVEPKLGILGAVVPTGRHQLRLRYRGTWVQMLGMLISLLGLAAFLATSARAPAPDDDAPRPLPSRTADRWLWPLGVILVTWGTGFTVMAGSDLFWHVAAGRLILESGSLPSVDPWSFSRAGSPWMNHEWLSQVVFALWMKVGGLESLVWWKWGVLVATGLIGFSAARRVSGSAAAGALAITAAFLVAAPFLDIRPHLHTLLATSILLRLLCGDSRHHRWLPLLFLVWANLHSGAFFGLLVLGISVAARIVMHRIQSASTPLDPIDLLKIPALCALACFFNPHGWEVYTYPLKYAFDRSSPFRTLGEWLPPSMPGQIQSPLFTTLAGLYLLSAGRFVWTRFRSLGARDLFLLGVSALTLAMAWRSRRFIPLFALCQSPVLATGFCSVIEVTRRAWPDPRWALVSSATLIGLGLSWLARYPVSTAAFPHLVVQPFFPVESLDFIEHNRLEGKIFAYYNWGGYLFWRNRGRTPVYIDGRADTVYDAETYTRYIAVLSGGPRGAGVVEASGADFFLWPNDQPMTTRRLVATGRWAPLYRDTTATLLVRVGATLPANITPPPDSGYRDLTLAQEALERKDDAAADARLKSALERVPHLLVAGYARAWVRLRGSYEVAWKIVAECQRRFPDRPRLDEFQERVRRLSRVPPPRGSARTEAPAP